MSVEGHTHTFVFVFFGKLGQGKNVIIRTPAFSNFVQFEESFRKATPFVFVTD